MNSLDPSSSSSKTKGEEPDGNGASTLMSNLQGRNSGNEQALPKNSASPGINQKMFRVCSDCHGQGKISKPPSHKARLRYKRRFMNTESSGPISTDGVPLAKTTASDNSTSENKNVQSTPGPAAKPPPRMEPCFTCHSTGLILVSDPTKNRTANSENSTQPPTLAIVGGGIAGFALAIACQHRGIPFFVLERDAHFSQRRQGYGLTLQQASKALKHFFGNASVGVGGTVVDQEDVLKEGITSTKHVVHTIDGKVVGEWGFRKWGRPKYNDINSNSSTTTTSKNNNPMKLKAEPKRQNIHIARQALRFQLLNAIEDQSKILWNSRLVQYRETDTGVDLTIQIGGETAEEKRETESDGRSRFITQSAQLIVGADGIRSQVRKQLIGEDNSPLRYLDCLVVLGICPLANLDETGVQSHPLLDGTTVFQTADGTTRMYMMPFSKIEYMWQLSFPLSEQEAIRISAEGPAALKQEAIQRCGSWHCPIPQILQATPTSLVSGYPVYDRELLQPSQLRRSNHVTLIGDACHPMSPFKGQGANQAMLDALSLANALHLACQVEQRQNGLAFALQSFEQEMLTRSSAKVQASADAVKFLHSEVAIQEGNVTRGGAAAVSAATTMRSNTFLGSSQEG